MDTPTVAYLISSASLMMDLGDVAIVRLRHHEVALATNAEDAGFAFGLRSVAEQQRLKCTPPPLFWYGGQHHFPVPDSR
jgi:hypothetical protein